MFFCTAHYAPHKIVLHFRETEISSFSCRNLEPFTCRKSVFREFIFLFVVPSGGRIVIILILAVVGVLPLNRAKVRVELDVHRTVADVLALTINRKELLDVECTASNADLIEGANLLRQELTHRLILVADYVSRFDTETYCGAHPGDAGREAVVWPTGEATEKTLRESTLRVVEADGVLLTDDSHLDAALDGMGYVVTQTDDPHGIGGVYRGYMLSDRVFKSSDGRTEWRAAAKSDAKPDGKAQEKEKRLQMSGKPLCGVLSPKVAAEAEKEFSKLIEAEVLSDKKTARFFTLEAPIVIGEEFKDMVSREFRRVVYTGTMGWRKQLVRPSHEVALGIWLARLSVSTGAGKS